MNRFFASLAFLLSLVAACASSGTDGRDALVNVVPEPAGSACEFGGAKIEAGIDANDDGVLGPTEVDKTTYACNGAPGAEGISTETTPEEPGTNCPAGGVRVDIGVDANRDGALDGDETTDTQFVCNGSDGEDGEDAIATITRVDTEPIGSNCPTGGLKVSMGRDTSGNGTLEPSEVTQEQFACNGSSAGGSLVDARTEPAGANCENGGVRLDTGRDDDGDGTLDLAEIDDTHYICETSSTGALLFATAYDPNFVSSVSGASITAISASISAPGPGTVIALGTSDVFCSSTGTTDYDCPAGTPSGHMRITSTSSASAAGDGGSWFWLEPDATESVTRQGVFDIAAGGTHVFYLRGSADAGEIGFFRNQLTLLYLPD